MLPTPCIMPDFFEDIFWDYTWWRDFEAFWIEIPDYTYDEYNKGRRDALEGEKS